MNRVRKHVATAIMVATIAGCGTAADGGAAATVTVTAPNSSPDPGSSLESDAQGDAGGDAPSDDMTSNDGTFSDYAEWDDGISYSVVSVRKFKASKFAVGLEKGLVPIEVVVEFTNKSNLLNLPNLADVELLVGQTENQASPFIDVGANRGLGAGTGWHSGEIRAGKSEKASFAFQADPNDVENGRVIVLFDRKLVGQIRLAGEISP